MALAGACAALGSRGGQVVGPVRTAAPHRTYGSARDLGLQTALVFYLLVVAGGLAATLVTRFEPRVPAERDRTRVVAATCVTRLT